MLACPLLLPPPAAPVPTMALSQRLPATPSALQENPPALPSALPCSRGNTWRRPTRHHWLLAGFSTAPAAGTGRSKLMSVTSKAHRPPRLFRQPTLPSALGPVRPPRGSHSTSPAASMNFPFLRGGRTASGRRLYTLFHYNCVHALGMGWLMPISESQSGRVHTCLLSGCTTSYVHGSLHVLEDASTS